MDWNVSRISTDNEENSLSRITKAFLLCCLFFAIQWQITTLSCSILGWTHPLSFSPTWRSTISTLNGSNSPIKYRINKIDMLYQMIKLPSTHPWCTASNCNISRSVCICVCACMSVSISFYEKNLYLKMMLL